jgi:TPR repeat protein
MKLKKWNKNMILIAQKITILAISYLLTTPVLADLPDDPCDDLKTLEIEAKNNDVNAQYDFAKCLIKNNKFEKAIKYLSEAAEEGHEFAQINLGHCYYNGLGVKKSEERAIRWYQAAAEQDNKWALYFLAQHHAKYARYEKAITLFKEAAEKTHISAVLALAKYYYEVAKDLKQAEFWFNRAKEFGYDSNIRNNPNRW